MAATILTAGAGFLLAVLWMDLMFDVQARRGGAVLDDSVLASIAGYYRRVTGQPMGALIGAVMVIVLVCLGIEAVRGGHPAWLIVASAVLAGGPILLALLRTVLNAVRLGRREVDAAGQTRLARAVLFDHVLCAIGMGTFLALWLSRWVN